MTEAIPVADVDWPDACRIIRSAFPPIDLFEDIADPADWPLLISAEQKSNPRLMENIGAIDLVPPARRVAGPGATWLMAPFTHLSRDRPSRFSAGDHGVLYAGNSFEVALFETIHHHAQFMKRTAEPAGWTSQFRETRLRIGARLHDIRADFPERPALLDPDNYAEANRFAARLREKGSDGLVYPSVRYAGGECVGLFYPDCASNPVQARHIDYHWNGARVDFYRDAGTGDVFAIG